MESLLEQLSLNEEEKVEASSPDVELNLKTPSPPPPPDLPQYNLPPELSVLCAIFKFHSYLS